MELLELALASLEKIRLRDPAMQSELYLSRGQTQSFELRGGALENIQHNAESGIGMRLADQGRMGFSYAGHLDSNRILDLFDHIRSFLAQVEPDSSKKFPSLKPTSPDGLAETLKDPTLLHSQRSLAYHQERLKEMEAQILARDKRIRKVLRIGYGEGWAESAIVNSLGVQAWEQGTHCSVGISVLAEEGSEVQIGSSGESRRFYEDLPFRRAASQAAERALALLGSRKLSSRRMDILLDPWVAAEFLELLSELLCADQVQKGKSLLAKHMGKPVASSLVTLTDDPKIPRGNASSLFDEEGVPTRRQVMVEKGILKNFFYDTATAAKEGRESSGSAGRASFKNPPSPGTSNFYLERGNLSREKLIQDTREGILVLDVMGMHMADPVSGEFSVGISGIHIEKGLLSHGIKGAMLSGNLLDLLKHVDAVADDLTFYGSLGSPTFRIRGMMVA